MHIIPRGRHAQSGSKGRPVLADDRVDAPLAEIGDFLVSEGVIGRPKPKPEGKAAPLGPEVAAAEVIEDSHVFELVAGRGSQRCGDATGGYGNVEHECEVDHGRREGRWRAEGTISAGCGELTARPASTRWLSSPTSPAVTPETSTVALAPDS